MFSLLQQFPFSLYTLFSVAFFTAYFFATTIYINDLKNEKEKGNFVLT
jgi:hypothetical protein